MSPTTWKIGLLTVSVLLLMLGCGSEVGERCDSPGSTDECVDGAVCTNDSFGFTCRTICFDQAQCPPGFNCNGISNTNLKSCQPG